jgi:hypothetical protein
MYVYVYSCAIVQQCIEREATNEDILDLFPCFISSKRTCTCTSSFRGTFGSIYLRRYFGAFVLQEVRKYWRTEVRNEVLPEVLPEVLRFRTIAIYLRTVRMYGSTKVLLYFPTCSYEGTEIISCLLCMEICSYQGTFESSTERSTFGGTSVLPYLLRTFVDIIMYLHKVVTVFMKRYTYM